MREEAVRDQRHHVQLTAAANNNKLFSNKPSVALQEAFRRFLNLSWSKSGASRRSGCRKRQAGRRVGRRRGGLHLRRSSVWA